MLAESVAERSSEVGSMVDRWRAQLDNALLKGRVLIVASTGALMAGNTSQYGALIPIALKLGAQSGCRGIEIFAELMTSPLRVMEGGIDPNLIDSGAEFFSAERAPTMNRVLRRLCGTSTSGITERSPFS